MEYFGFNKESIGKLSPMTRIVRAYFYSRFDMEKIPGTLLMKIAAMSVYKLWINGEAVLSGPCRSREHTMFYDTVDIAPYLKCGKNTITVNVMSYPAEPESPEHHRQYNVFPGIHGPLLAAECDEIDFSWHILADNSVSGKFEPIRAQLDVSEIADGSKKPPVVPEDIDSLEPACSYGMSEPSTYGEYKFPFLRERPIPLLYRKKRCYKFMRALTVPPHSKGKMLVEADKITTAFFRLNVVGGKGSRIKITYAENLWTKGDDGIGYKGIRDVKGGYVHGCSDEYLPSGGDEIYEPFLIRTFRFIEIEAETAEEEVYFRPLEYIETAYPLDVRAEIKSDIPWVKKVWKISADTLQNCMHDTYEDCPYYEQLQYAMDTRLEALYTYAAIGDTRLAKRAIEDFYSSVTDCGLLASRYPSSNPQIIPGFSLHWILMLKDYYLQTGDKKILRRMIPRAETVLNAFAENTGSHGMIEPMGYWDFADWNDDRADLNGEPEAIKYGPSALHNLFFVYAARETAALFREMGRNGTAEEYEEIAQNIADAVEKYCYNPQRKMYREGMDFEQYSQHTQIWAVLSGVCGGEKAKNAMSAALEDGDVIRCSFAMQFYLFRALEKTGMYEKTYPQWDMWKNLIDLHCTTIPETPKNPRSECHAWGALALHEFPAKILGVQYAAPGGTKITIAPRTDFAQKMSGKVPVSSGEISVAWDNAVHRLEISAPEGINAKVYLPDGSRVPFCGGYVQYDI